jgi:hypothetical protein
MSTEPVTNGKRAALGLQAVSTYARSSPFEAYGEHGFFFDFERDATPEADEGRLAALLSGLMHYAERRGLSFGDALATARQEYDQQRTTYLPGQAVQRAHALGHQAPHPGEVIAARPGRPAEYHVDFITSREWLPETALLPAPPFPAITTRYGTFSSAFVTGHLLRRVISELEAQGSSAPDSGRLRDLDTMLTALSSWTGLTTGTLLKSFSTLAAGQGGHPPAAAHNSHPASLSATSIPSPPLAPAGSPSAVTSQDAAVLPLQRPSRRPPGQMR